MEIIPQFFESSSNCQLVLLLLVSKEVLDCGEKGRNTINLSSFASAVKLALLTATPFYAAPTERPLSMPLAIPLKVAKHPSF